MTGSTGELRRNVFGWSTLKRAANTFVPPGTNDTSRHRPSRNVNATTGTGERAGGSWKSPLTLSCARTPHRCRDNQHTSRGSASFVIQPLRVPPRRGQCHGVGQRPRQPPSRGESNATDSSTGDCHGHCYSAAPAPPRSLESELRQWQCDHPVSPPASPPACAVCLTEL